VVGIGVDMETAKRDMDESTTEVRLRAYGQKTGCLAPSTCVSVQAVGSMSGAGPGFHVRGTVSKRWSPVLWTNGSLSVERSPETFVEDMERRISADMTVTARLSERWSVDGIALFRAHRLWRVLNDPEGVVTTNLIPELTSVLVDSNATGCFGGFGLAVRWQSSNAGASGSYTVQENMSATAGMARRWALVPRHRFRQHFWLRLGDELTAQLSVEARSSLSVPNLVFQDDEARPVSTGNALMADLTVLKWFWGGRARASVRLRDLTNKRTPAHPLGATPGLTLFVQGDLVVSYRSSDRLR